MAGRRRNGEGGISVRPDGRFNVRWHDANGARICRTVRHLDAAQRILAEALTSRFDGRSVGKPSKVTVADHFWEWIADVKSTTAPQTSRRYEQHVRLHILPVIGTKRLVALDKDDIKRVIRENRAGTHTSRPLGETTLHHVFAVLHRALEVAVREERIPTNPARLVEAPQMQLREKIILTRDEVARFLQAARADRLEAAFILAITTAMREGEILGLRWRENVDLESGTIVVDHNLVRTDEGLQLAHKPKTASGRRTIRLLPLAIEALREHQRTTRGSALVFPTRSGRPMSASNFLSCHFHPTLRRAGLPHMPFHDLRHSAATLALQAGAKPLGVAEWRASHRSR